MEKKSISCSAFLSPRGLIALLLCGSACFIAVGTVQAFLHPEARAKVSQRTLTFAERVSYQRAIEEVYWLHWIWPKENPNPKPSLDAVMSQAQLEKKVADYLRKSKALEDYWQRPLTAEQLQAEMDRMAQHTKQPEVLRELFEALGNDPFVIAECLARPVLAGRGIAVVSARDESFQERLDSMHAKVAQTLQTAVGPGSSTYALPEISVPVSCTDDGWTATSVTGAPDVRANHTAVWTGNEMIVWGGYNTNGGLNTMNSGGRYNPATDSWIATSTANAPTGRNFHTAVWTGSEMIVWGGYNYPAGDLITGGKYSPTDDSWTAISNPNLRAREQHTAVWTGNEMVVWGGGFNGGGFHDGGRYNPNTDSWTPTSQTNEPAGRWGHTAVWTGSEMIIWGGTDSMNYLHTGGRYNPASDSWTPTSTANAPLGRVGHTTIWSGGEMNVWGGTDSTFNDTNTGGRYDPTGDSWTAISTVNAPSARDSHTAVWAGSEMIVWGGVFCCPAIDFNTGGRYNGTTNSWIATNTASVPFARYDHTAVWTGSEMIIWGGYNYTARVFFNTGATYCAQSQAPMAQSAFSRKTHGAAGTFDVPLPLTGNVGIEYRSGGATNDYQMIINFATTVTVGSASVTSGTGSVSGFSVSGPGVTVNLSGVTNVQRIMVTLFNVNDGTQMGNVPVSMGVLVGDVNGDAVVNASDVSLTKAQAGQMVSGSNFREDVTANGVINAADVAQVKANAGTALPP